MNDEYFSQFLSDCKVLWMTLEQLVEIFIKLPICDTSRAICILLRGKKINFWSHLDKERPEIFQNFHRTPSRGRIESNKSAGNRSQKVTSQSVPWKMRLEMVKQMQIEILNGKEILVNYSKSRKSNLSVSDGTKSNWNFDCVWIPRYLAIQIQIEIFV